MFVARISLMIWILVLVVVDLEWFGVEAILGPHGAYLLGVDILSIMSYDLTH